MEELHFLYVFVQCFIFLISEGISMVRWGGEGQRREGSSVSSETSTMLANIVRPRAK